MPAVFLSVGKLDSLKVRAGVNGIFECIALLTGKFNQKNLLSGLWVILLVSAKNLDMKLYIVPNTPLHTIGRREY